MQSLANILTLVVHLKANEINYNTVKNFMIQVDSKPGRNNHKLILKTKRGLITCHNKFRNIESIFS